ncbi:telomere zinc finger-associated protein-like isoform X3 [Haliotis asinina]|uniref:telomere zinc finger-associated protein-like isoform X3 n=1 Tax=Haliotis asinina TaxID=109174 RepID=UPI0035323286
MEKQYSVEFFMNFVENIQNLCHNFLEFNQNVEVSGYVCVDIDNMKKERYVLSEIVQMGGNSISESYCTKVFKTSPTGTVQRSGFRDITNARLPNVSPSAGEVDVPGHSYSLQRMRTGPPRKGEISHTLSLNRTASPRSQTKTAVGQNYGDYQSHSGISNSNNTFGNPTARGIQGHEPGSESQIRTKARSLTTKLCRTSTVPESSVLKRQHEHSPLSDSADDTDVIVVKQEPGDEEQEESGDQPPIKRRSETFRLPSSLTGAADTGWAAPDDVHDTSNSMFHSETSSDLTDLGADVHQFGVTGDASTEHGAKPSIASVVSNIRPAPLVTDTASGKKMTCQLCGNSAWSDMGFMMHMNNHPSCKECGVYMATHMDLRGHIEMEHGRMNMHMCRFCDKVFLTKSGVTEHQRLKHEKTAPKFVCMICGHVCVRKRHLEDHVENVHNKKNKLTS